MKLCQIMAGNEEGGLENHFIQLCNGLVQTQPDVALTVIAHQKYADRFHPAVQFLPLDLTKGRNNPLILFRLARLLREHPMDVIHAHANKATSMLATIRNFVPGKKIATVHSQKKNNKMFEVMDWVIGVSKNVLRNIENKNKSVIYNGIPETFFKNPTQEVSRKSLGIDNSLPIVISIGRLVQVKGLDVLLESWQNINANLLIVGEGELLEQLKTTVSRNAYLKNVYFLGQRSDIKNLLVLSDLTVISSYREGFSYVVAESLLTHTPVISTDVPVANEILPKKYIVKTGDSEALHQLIERIVQQLDRLDNEFLVLYNFSKNEFTECSMIQKIAALYKTLI